MRSEEEVGQEEVEYEVGEDGDGQANIEDDVHQFRVRKKFHTILKFYESVRCINYYFLYVFVNAFVFYRLDD